MGDRRCRLPNFRKVHRNGNRSIDVRSIDRRRCHKVVTAFVGLYGKRTSGVALRRDGQIDVTGLAGGFGCGNGIRRRQCYGGRLLGARTCCLARFQIIDVLAVELFSACRRKGDTLHRVAVILGIVDIERDQRCDRREGQHRILSLGERRAGVHTDHIAVQHAGFGLCLRILDIERNVFMRAGSILVHLRLEIGIVRIHLRRLGVDLGGEVGRAFGVGARRHVQIGLDVGIEAQLVARRPFHACRVAVERRTRRNDLGRETACGLGSRSGQCVIGYVLLRTSG